MADRKRFVRLVLLAAAVPTLVALLSFVVYRTRTGHKPPAADPARIQQAEDLKKLEDPKATAEDLHAALLRLEGLKDPAARRFALATTRHESPVVREAAADTLAREDDPALMETLLPLLNDPSERVRLRLIQVLAGAKNARPAVFPAFKKRLASLGTTKASQEKALLLYAMARTAPSESDARSARSALAALFHSPGLTPELRRQAAFLLGMVAGNDPSVTEGFRKALTASLGTDSVFAAQLIDHLASLPDPWLKPRLAGFARNPDLRIRLAAVRGLPLVCPPDAKELLESLEKNETEPSMKRELANAREGLRNCR